VGAVLCSRLVRSGHQEGYSWGLLLGCHLREHRWQKFKMMFVSHRWRQLNRGLWSSPGAVLATVSGVITIVLFLAAIVQWLAQAT
jgi:hypothetical protein